MVVGRDGAGEVLEALLVAQLGRGGEETHLEVEFNGERLVE